MKNFQKLTKARISGVLWTGLNQFETRFHTSILLKSPQKCKNQFNFRTAKYPQNAQKYPDLLELIKISTTLPRNSLHSRKYLEIIKFLVTVIHVSYYLYCSHHVIMKYFVNRTSCDSKSDDPGNIITWFGIIHDSIKLVLI